MRKIIFLILLWCFLPAVLFAQGMQPVGHVVTISAGACDGSSATGFNPFQNLEGTGLDNSETWSTYGSGTINLDYTTTALRGSQSISISDTSSETMYYHATDDLSTIWVFFRFRKTADWDSTGEFFWIGDSSYNKIVTLVPTGATSANLVSGTASTAISYTWSNNTTYFVWLKYVKGTGANGVAEIYITTSGTKPSLTATVTTGSATTNAAFVGLESYATASVFIFDQIMARGTSIGNVCN
jgi:hypothetical protein